MKKIGLLLLVLVCVSGLSPSVSFGATIPATITFLPPQGPVGSSFTTPCNIGATTVGTYTKKYFAPITTFGFANYSIIDSTSALGDAYWTNTGLMSWTTIPGYGMWYDFLGGGKIATSAADPGCFVPGDFGITYQLYTCPSGYTISGVNCVSNTGNINISPSQASAPWTLSNCKSQTGTGSLSISSVPTGTCTVTWGAVSGYTTPASQTQALTTGATISFVGNYVATSCSNGANNPLSCTQCPANTGWDTISSSCLPCANGGCTGAGGSQANPGGSLVCNNGAINPLYCGVCGSGKTFVSGSCVANCVNGATNPPTCTTCPVGQSLVAGSCVANPICNNNNVCNPGETFLNCSHDCSMNFKNF